MRPRQQQRRPLGRWIIWVTLHGLLLVSPGHAPRPDRTAWPLGAESDRQRAHEARLRIGRRRKDEPAQDGAVVVENFDGTIGAALALAELLAERQPGVTSPWCGGCWRDPAA